MMGMGLGVAELGVLVVIFAGLGFWIWMLVDCAVHEVGPGDDRLVWILILVFTGWIGGLVYLIVRRPKRKRLLGQ